MGMQPGAARPAPYSRRLSPEKGPGVCKRLAGGRSFPQETGVSAPGASRRASPCAQTPDPECRAQVESSSGLCTPGLKLLCVLDKAQLTPGTQSPCGGSRLTSARTPLHTRPGHPDGRHMGRQLARGAVPLPPPYVGGSLQPSFPKSVAGQLGIYSTDGGRPGLAHPPARGGLPSHGTRGIPA